MPLPSFKSVIAGDTAAVFINQDEFAETHTINGRPMPAIIDNNELLDRQKGGGGFDRKDGIFAADILLYVKANDYGPRPKAGAIIVLDNRPYKVMGCADEAGIYSITMEATRV